MIIVTGGAGFIGSNIARGLNDLGIEDIIIIDDLKNASKHKNLNRIKFLDYIDKEDSIDFIYSFIKKNKNGKNNNKNKKNKIEAVFHQGACSDTMETDGNYMMKNNYEYGKNILHICLENKIRFLYASSASVYGNGEKGFAEKEENEYPLNVYAFSKYQFDRYVNILFKQKKIKSQVVGLRYFNVYGQQENHKGKMASVAFHLFNQIKSGENMKIFEGSENFLRDFIYIDDVVSVNNFFFENEKIKGIFNCGTGHAESFLEIAKALKEIYTKSNIEYIPFPNALKGKYQKFTQADLTNLRKAGYDKKFINVNSGVKKYAKILEESGGYLI